MDHTKGKETDWQGAVSVLREYIDKRNMTQTELVRQAKEKGYQINQGNVSKLLQGKKKMSLEECRAFCDVLAIPSARLLFPGSQRSLREDSFFCLSERMLESARGIIGEYEMYFLSTAKEEAGKIISGTMKLYYDNSYIRASIKINIANSVPKEYRGYLWLQANQATVAYIIVKRFPKGELSIVSFRYRKFDVESMKCRKALCLTTSAGENKEPVIHCLAMIRSSLISDSIRKDLMQKVQEYFKEGVDRRVEVEEDLKFFQWFDNLRREQHE